MTRLIEAEKKMKWETIKELNLGGARVGLITLNHWESSEADSCMRHVSESTGGATDRLNLPVEV